MGYEPTSEQIAQAEEKRLKRLEKKLWKEKQHKQSDQTVPLFLSRPWIPLKPPDHLHTQTVSVMTWNLLAQCLVRSELFPTSGKARKASERIPMLHAEILSHDADILCMQEVDGLHKLLPVLDLAGYAYSYASGTDKPHGCLIAYKNTIFQSVHEAMIEYDTLEVHSNPELSTQARIGSSHRTKNIAKIVALQSIGPESAVQSYIVATTHLFWHPAFSRVGHRQAGLLVREVIAFQELWKLRGWPCIIAGAPLYSKRRADFNFPPDDPAYSLLAREPLSLEQQERLQVSRVVHVSIDPTVPTSIAKEANKGGSEQEADPDRVVRNSRNSKPSDGLLSDTELSILVGHCLRSAYDEGQRSSLVEGNDVATYGARALLPAKKVGASHEVPDYIFILDAPGSETRVTGYLQPHRTDDVVRGLPQIGICGSDHFSLCTQLVTLPATL
ncbi:Endonuclease/exonuclease/phosphatase [Butyriboletus roseoflavus]|nr:Endonuclease/exonuclease/phosphatase [Butyriboletus roseoflavus]